jgi:hypothetical protein
MGYGVWNQLAGLVEYDCDLFHWRWGAVKEFTKLFMVFGSAYLFWHMRHQMTRVATAYGFFSFLLIINSGAVLSVNRYVYVW